MKNGYGKLVIAGLVAIFLSLIAVQAVLSMRQESPTFDEVILLPAGYSYWKTGDFRLDFDSPPLVKLIAAVPLLSLNLPLKTKGIESWETANELVFGHGFLYHQDADRIMFWGRLAIVVISLLLALFVFRWARELYGLAAGFLALFLYSFEPNILAHSRLITTDLGVTAFSTIALYYFYRLGRDPNPRNLVLSGITFGLALASKFSAILLIPVYLTLSVFKILSVKEVAPPLGFLPGGGSAGRKFLTEMFTLVLVFAIGFGVIFFVYGARATPIYSLKAHGGKHPELLEKMWPGKNSLREAAYFVLEQVPVPAGGWFRGLFSQVKHTGKGARAFFMGRYSSSGWWYYYLMAFFIKTPVALLLLLVVNLALFRKREGRDVLGELYLIVPVLFIFGVSLVNRIAIGLRYILPAYPLLFILASRIIDVRIEKRIILNIGVAVLLLWFLFSSASIYPHYLAYFNELVGGPGNGYRYLVDSNLDWGQDLKNLKRYVEQNNIRKIKLAYFGTANPDYYKIPYERVTEEEMHQRTPGVYAISATELQNALSDDKTRFAWIKKYQPKAKIGYSIFVYEIR